MNGITSNPASTHDATTLRFVITVVYGWLSSNTWVMIKRIVAYTRPSVEYTEVIGGAARNGGTEGTR